MTMMIDLRAAMRAEVRHICAEHGKDYNFARRAIRVELSPDAEMALMREWTGLTFEPPSPRGKPLTLEGVSIYCVYHDGLPACGWRVVNPFRKGE